MNWWEYMLVGFFLENLSESLSRYMGYELLILPIGTLIMCVWLLISVLRDMRL